MPLYYAELFNESTFVKSKAFDDDTKAIAFFKEKYKDNLMAVVKDSDPKIVVIWENYEKSK